MAIPAADGGSTRTYVPQPEPRPTPTPTPTATPTPTSSYRPEPTYNPHAPAAPVVPTGPSGVGGTQYGIPAGSTLSDVTRGTGAQPFDVTLSQLATAVYGTRGAAPEGWSAVSDQQLIDRGVADPQAWREQYLGADEHLPPDQQNPQEFRAEVYTDGQGNFVLSYRGTAEGGADWENNFRQGLGYETNQGDKFAVTAASTGREFADVFGNGGSGAASTNLAITGHSQGGGLATMGSLSSGVPAVTFDASGIHPNTLENIGLAPQAARDFAEGGNIRAYSLSGDALTRVQDSWVTGLAAPDALGTQIVVDPAAADANNMFTHYGPIEGVDNAGLVNTGVELARDPVTGTLLSAPLGAGAGWLLGGPAGAPVGAVVAPLITVGGGNLAYAAISHSPNALTNAMIDRQPWQPGYENPSSWTRDAQNLLPDYAKDDYARNVHDFATDIDQVVATDFANGDYVQGVASLTGDFYEGAWNSVGDTADGYADQWADGARRNVGGLPGEILAVTLDGGGDVIEFGTDVVGQASETLNDGAGWVGQKATDFVGWALGG